jgi:muramoyltetrapeptide carboxypeptidase
VQPCVPPPCRAGSNVALVAPSGPVKRSELERGMRVLEGWGLRPRLFLGAEGPPHAAGYLAGASDADRAHQLERAFNDPTIDAVICARGGYGCLRLLGEVVLELDRIVVSEIEAPSL